MKSECCEEVQQVKQVEHDGIESSGKHFQKNNYIFCESIKQGNLSNHIDIIYIHFTWLLAIGNHVNNAAKLCFSLNYLVLKR